VSYEQGTGHRQQNAASLACQTGVNNLSPLLKRGTSMATASRVKSAERTLDVLDLLARREVPLTTLQIADAVGIPKSTTHHLLNVMHERHFVSYISDQRVWTLGVAALEIGASYTRNGSLAREGHRFLRALSEGTQVTSHLAIRQGTDVVYLDKLEPRAQGVRLVTEVGTRLPAHLTAVGRSILSAIPVEEVYRMYEGYSWPTRTGSGPASFDELRTLLDSTKHDGYAQEKDTTSAGITCIASPVYARDGLPTAALGIAFLSATHDENTIASFSGAVMSAAAEFSAALGAKVSAR
jgi:DNA-binding IclR family transcriptional regulator